MRGLSRGPRGRASGRRAGRQVEPRPQRGWWWWWRRRFDEDDVRRRVRASLAGRKTPKRILGVQAPLRASSGKADYKAITEFARRDVGLGS